MLKGKHEPFLWLAVDSDGPYFRHAAGNVLSRRPLAWRLWQLQTAHVSPWQEALWYAAYAVMLWMLVIIIIRWYGKNLAKPMSAE